LLNYNPRGGAGRRAMEVCVGGQGEEEAQESARGRRANSCAGGNKRVVRKENAASLEKARCPTLGGCLDRICKDAGRDEGEREQTDEATHDERLRALLSAVHLDELLTDS